VMRRAASRSRNHVNFLAICVRNRWGSEGLRCGVAVLALYMGETVAGLVGRGDVGPRSRLST
jgi:hypothetical protein